MKGLLKFMVGKDLNEKTYTNENLTVEERNILVSKAIEIGNILHRYSLWMIVAALIGVSVGVKASQFYYNSKMTEATMVGGIVFKEKVYQVTPK